MSLPPLAIPRFAAAGAEPPVIPALPENWTSEFGVLPVSRTVKLPGPAGPRPKSSANAEQLQNMTSIRIVIPTAVARHAPQEPGLLHERALPEQWNAWAVAKDKRSRGIVKTVEISNDTGA